MKNVTVSNLSLVLAFALVLVSIAISAKEKLGLTKDILISVIRAIVQLVIIGFVLKFIFHIDTLWLTAVSINSVFIVFICSGLIGELSFLFKTDLSYLLAFIFHLIGTLALFSIMMFLNNWLINWQTLFIFILAYAMIWLVIRLTQERDIRRINQEA
ncbi:ABC transporter permease [Lactobacillus paragasseri]|uniref:ABC transporter permease n=2 Tax=Lactobacillus paragasseri TaxID=2107999 RepID=A0ABD4ZYG0_9LACO|nr:ABC transporter permease [Lactobacillus paragasseri]MDK7068605.1 ABC transporter permease [Lactobacillus paragasseri]MDK7951901.1 ABC transporter permease [Lactobacillus paragasseri]MDO6360556.1 ABC transporter permease [Lactobacillus paragasseri]MDX5059427.1 ABC transporter permease [Lactobacillus paragasseri]